MSAAVESGLRIIHPKWPELFVVRKARNAHACERGPRNLGDVRHWDHGPVPGACTGSIKPSEQYVEYEGGAPPYHQGPRYCRHCAIAAGIATDGPTVRDVQRFRSRVYKDLKTADAR